MGVALCTGFTATYVVALVPGTSSFPRLEPTPKFSLRFVEADDTKISFFGARVGPTLDKRFIIIYLCSRHVCRRHHLHIIKIDLRRVRP